MAIVDIKKALRPNTSVEFFSSTEVKPDGSHSPDHSGKPAAMALINSGKVGVEFSLSDDQLVQTQILTFQDLETYSQFDTAVGIELDSLFITFVEETNLPVLNNNTTPRPFVNTGIDQPFTATYVYTFQANDPTMGIFASSVGLDSTLNVTVGDNTVTVVKQYANSADFSDNIFNDLRYVRQLNEKGVTRTITYAYVS